MNKHYAENVLKIPNHIPGSNVAQYMFRKGVKQFNLCGELAVAFTMQDEAATDDIDAFLDYWQAKSPNLYNSIFYKGFARTTGIPDLKGMLDDYEAAYLPVTGLTLDGTAKMLEMYQLIVGVKIDWTGYLVGQGIPHWVVVDSITLAIGNSGNVVLYNPFTNAMQPFGWREFMTSCGPSKYGLWVKR